MYDILIHETTNKNLSQILRTNVLLKSSQIQKLGLSTLQGNLKRKLCTNPKVSLYDKNFYEKYDEVDGVYFRLWSLNTPINLNYGECALVFLKDDILNHHNFIINTEENYGFCIAEDGIISKSHFSGEEGLTISTLKNLKLLDNITFNPYNSEVLILDNVKLTNLHSIIFKK